MARIPSIIYGTAWKEERTEALVRQALDAGYTAIDTANQRKHYYEEGVGNALAHFLQTGHVPRADLFLQTKFTYAAGQDHRLPYDVNASFAQQVRQSCHSSLEHLGVDYIDSYILHGPSAGTGLTSADMEVWAAMEALVNSHQVRMLGVSNVNLDQLKLLYRNAHIKPEFVQNRCFAATGWDKDIRDFCTANGIYYQGFSLLTANARELQNPAIAALAKSKGKTIPQTVFRFAVDVGMMPLTGTTDENHMREDLDIFDFELTKDEIALVENIAQKQEGQM
ncbi:MAG: aldo/keto reductase [Pseudomonadota bacterium]|nr:aldo/keto reductase [Pseudomonadota bacterium]QKK04625.1 MAG: aldo/keto reductase [Pseudomonadota bacterium]